MMYRIFTATVFSALMLSGMLFDKAVAQTAADFQGGIIRITQIGQLGDTLSVWGDVRTPGRYLVPRNSPVAKVLQFAGGPAGNQRIGGGRDPWSRSRISISISRFDDSDQVVNYHQFNMKYNDEIPREMRTYELNNDDIIIVEVRQVPGFLDVLGVVGPILGTITTSYLLYDRLLR